MTDPTTPTVSEIPPPPVDPTKPGGGFRLVLWRFFGALFMEEKKNNGNRVQAVSYHKTLGFVLFIVVVCIWSLGGTHLSNVEVMVVMGIEGASLPSKWGEPPDMMVYTLWSLIGLKGVSKVADLLKK